MHLIQLTSPLIMQILIPKTYIYIYIYKHIIYQIKHLLPHRFILLSLASKFYNITRKMISQPAELVFVPSPGVGHLVSTVEMAKLLVARDSRLFITVLIIKYPFTSSSVNSYSESLLSSSSPSELERIKLIDLPETQTDGADFNVLFLLSSFFENKKPLVRDAVSKLAESRSGRPGSPRLAGFVVDMFTTNMMDVADEFGLPSYVFFTSGAGLLTLTSSMLTLCDEHGIDTTDFKDKPDSELFVPGFSNPVPAKVLPDVLLDKGVTPFYHNHNRKIRDQSKGILVNTFMELEPNIIHSFTHSKYPPIYPVGPVLNLNNQGGTDKKTDDIVTWLDKQPPSSVVFLCFGSKGCFCEEQVKEIAMALERSGVRFLWSLRRPPQKGKFDSPADYTDPNEVLPEGFLSRTAEIGKVIGWAPQTTVLAHPAVGGFLSHCGWNSILESLWFGVPTATWSLFAEQQLNAFEMVVELGLAVEIKIDYRKELGNDLDAVILRAEEIERGIRSLMQHDIDIRKRVKEMSEQSRKSLLNGGSSYSSLGRFIDDVIQNMP